MSVMEKSKFMLVLIGGSEASIKQFMETADEFADSSHEIMLFGVPITQEDFGMMLDSFLDKMVRMGIDSFDLRGENAEANLRKLMQVKFQSGGKQN